MNKKHRVAILVGDSVCGKYELLRQSNPDLKSLYMLYKAYSTDIYTAQYDTLAEALAFAKGVKVCNQSTLTTVLINGEPYNID